ncbi:hypothetical protein SESBI_11877 [Sesbania bispinosa]|nr:hypothetical protein SESBI_11877 [Sesbania bispinosa]
MVSLVEGIGQWKVEIVTTIMKSVSDNGDGRGFQATTTTMIEGVGQWMVATVVEGVE